MANARLCIGFCTEGDEYVAYVGEVGNEKDLIRIGSMASTVADNDDGLRQAFMRLMRDAVTVYIQQAGASPVTWGEILDVPPEEREKAWPAS